MTRSPREAAAKPTPDHEPRERDAVPANTDTIELTEGVEEPADTSSELTTDETSKPTIAPAGADEKEAARIARGRHEELAMHVRAARRNGLRNEEIKELLLQTALYRAAPEANSTAFCIAGQVLAGCDAGAEQ